MNPVFHSTCVPCLWCLPKSEWQGLEGNSGDLSEIGMVFFFFFKSSFLSWLQPIYFRSFAFWGPAPSFFLLCPGERETAVSAKGFCPRDPALPRWAPHAGNVGRRQCGQDLLVVGFKPCFQSVSTGGEAEMLASQLVWNLGSGMGSCLVDA